MATKLKKNQIGPWCSFCKPKTIRAVYVERGWTGKFACEVHKDKLEMAEGRITEADFQTWMRLR